ncbi:MAG: N-acetylneuraminate synthase family protein [Deltaproteobacteria bacterium]|jgi:sialic acid synthase SpsE|nr:N-acetylneuraminate synthase family protein [Deltaproteobacteria bacterium]
MLSGQDPKPVIVAEIGGNHGGDPGRAAELCRKAARAGAQAVKFQIYRTDLFVHPRASYYEELKREELPPDTWLRLIGLSRELGLLAGVTVFDEAGLDLALKAEADYLKISSGDLTYRALIKMAARTDRPLVLSAGAASESEVTQALSAAGYPGPILLQCTSLYPAPRPAVNLAAVHRWQEQNRLAGLSDHSLGLEVSLAAAEMGAVMIEKHFTADRRWPGGDNAMSIMPEEMRYLAAFSQNTIKARPFSEESQFLSSQKAAPDYWGRPEKTVQPAENPRLIRRWAVAARTLAAGRNLSPEDIIFLRVPLSSEPGLGPDQELAGLETVREIPIGSPLALKDLRNTCSKALRPKGQPAGL